MEKRDYQTSVQALLAVIKRKCLWIAVCTIIFAVATALVTHFVITPVYSSTAKFYVYNDPNNTSSALSSQDISAAKSLVDTYIVIIKSDSVLDKVLKKSGVDLTPKQLKKKLASGSLSGTAAFFVTVSDTDSEEAYKLTKAFVEVIPDVITDVVKAGGVSVFDEPEKAVVPDSPSVSLNTVIGAATGLLISFLYFFLRELLDDTVFSSDDLSTNFSYPVIGAIPSFSATEKHGSYAGKSGTEEAK